MPDAHPEQESRTEGVSWFVATHWTVVLAAGQAEQPRRAQALETLCRTYWEPLYAYLRYQGHSPPDAEDLTQAFLLHLVERGVFEQLRPEKGKFRTFLLKSLHNFVADARARAGAARRGGGQPLLSLDAEGAERHYAEAAAEAPSADALFDRRWAMTVLNGAFRRLQEEFLAKDKAQQLAELAVFLAAEGDGAQYQAAAQRLGMTSGAVSVAVSRLRERYRACIGAEIAHTVASLAEVDEEMRYLFDVLNR